MSVQGLRGGNASMASIRLQLLGHCAKEISKPGQLKVSTDDEGHSKIQWTARSDAAFDWKHPTTMHSEGTRQGWMRAFTEAEATELRTRWPGNVNWNVFQPHQIIRLARNITQHYHDGRGGGYGGDMFAAKEEIIDDRGVKSGARYQQAVADFFCANFLPW